MLSTFPADESKGEMVVLVSDGKGEELCDGDGADDMTWHNDVGDCDDDWGLKTWASAFRGFEPMGGWGAVGAVGAGPSASLSSGIGLLGLQLLVSLGRWIPKCSGRKLTGGVTPWQGRPLQPPLLNLRILNLRLAAPGANTTFRLSDLMWTLNPPTGRKHLSPLTFRPSWYKVTTKRARMVSSHMLWLGSLGFMDCGNVHLPRLTYICVQVPINVQIPWIDYHLATSVLGTSLFTCLALHCSFAWHFTGHLIIKAEFSRLSNFPSPAGAQGRKAFTFTWLITINVTSLGF